MTRYLKGTTTQNRDGFGATNALLRSKSNQENMAAGLPGKLAAAIEKSNRLMAEGIIQPEGFPEEAVKNYSILLIIRRKTKK